MGTTSYIVWDEGAQRYELGKHVNLGDTEDFLHQEGSQSALNELSWSLSSFDQGHSRRVAYDIFKWCKERGWHVRLVSDSSEEFDQVSEYVTAGSVYDVVYLYPQDIREVLEEQVDRLMQELGAERVDVRVSAIGTSKDERTSERWRVQAISSDDGKSSGYDRQALPDDDDDDFGLDSDSLPFSKF